MSDDKVYSPINGVVVSVFPTNHAFCIKGHNGEEIMVHIGVDTNLLNNGVIESKFKKGDEISEGDLLAEINLEEYKHEVVIMGKAIGVKCNRILGARIDNELIERVFVSNNNQNYVEAIIEKIPYNMFKVVELVIKQAEQDLNTKFKDAIYLALVDHIYFSYKTIKEGGKIENPLLNEIKLFHPSEFIAAMNSINTINRYLNADFDQQEASYIAFHYINALSNLSTTEQKSIMKDLEATLNFIDDLTSNSLNKNSYQYGRLIIHLKCLFGRLIGDDRTGRKTKI